LQEKSFCRRTRFGKVFFLRELELRNGAKLPITRVYMQIIYRTAAIALIFSFSLLAVSCETPQTSFAPPPRSYPPPSSGTQNSNADAMTAAAVVGGVLLLGAALSGGSSDDDSSDEGPEPGSYEHNQNAIMQDNWNRNGNINDNSR
jgi:hypothetical protein